MTGMVNPNRPNGLEAERTSSSVGAAHEGSPNGAQRAHPAGGESAVDQPARRKLPDERASITHKFSIGGHEGYTTVGLYEDGAPGELFIRMAKQGSTISGLMDSLAIAISLALQYGVPLRVLVDKFAHARFEPSGWTGNPQIPYAKSAVDYIFRWLGAKFLGPECSATDGGEDRAASAIELDTRKNLRFSADAAAGR